MGAWGPGLYDNDNALNLTDALEDLARAGMAPSHALEALPDWSVGNLDAQLVLVDMGIEFDLRDVVDSFSYVLDEALSQEELTRWHEPDVRAERLDELAFKLDGYADGVLTVFRKDEPGELHAWIQEVLGH